MLRNITSDELRIDRGVSQGTVRGPLILKFYIYDIYIFKDNNTQLRQYADDTLFLTSD